jgi:glycosyltransferase involved in cell wall biosynthesis
MRIVHVAESINENLGGPAFAVTQLAAATAATGEVRAEILAFDLPRLGKPLPASDRVPVTLFRPLRPFLWGLSAPYARRLGELARDPEVIFHLHAIWRLPTVTASRLARRRRLPVLVSTRGTLDPWSLAHRAGRKKILWRLLVKRVLERADLLCAASPQEAEGIAALLPKVPIAIIPNGIDLPDLGSAPPRLPARTALYLSRIAPNKGLLDLLRAWAVAQPPGWSLRVAGPDEAGHRAVCAAAVRELGLERSVTFLGPVHGEQKWATFRAADLFILPTRGENFGVVVAEALAAGLPVICTRGAPWAELSSRQCGWWVELGVEPLAAALREAVAREAELPEMGARGRALAEEKYAWPGIAREMIAAYRWVAGDGPRPASVIS